MLVSYDLRCQRGEVEVEKSEVARSEIVIFLSYSCWCKNVLQGDTLISGVNRFCTLLC